MPTYLSPGVYVEEIPSGSAPIVGVGTSIAAFIGTIKPTSASNPTTNDIDISFNVKNEEDQAKRKLRMSISEQTKNILKENTIQYVAGSINISDKAGVEDLAVEKVEIQGKDSADITFNKDLEKDKVIKGKFKVKITNDQDTSPYKLKQVIGEKVGKGDANVKEFELSNYPVVTSGFKVEVGGEDKTGDVETLKNDEKAKKSQIKFTKAPESGKAIIVDYYIQSVSEGIIKLCTNFTEFTKFFGGFFSESPEGQNTLAHAVYGFFRNGGTRCYVTWITEKKEVDNVLEKFEAIDEITIVAAPGSKDLRANIKDHCEKMSDRIAVLDSVDEIELSNAEAVKNLKPFNSNYAALYFPWIQVYDPASDSNIYIPPSGHIAGVYARVDGQRGVHKAPANETILGALDLKYNLSKAKQDGLNPKGINCIRKLNGNIRVWGARTLGGDDNGEFKYVNIRRQFCYLRDSIDQGTQWTVFEPNDPELWAKIRRNVSAFLVNEWRKGALFGTTPQEAFYVKCDAENNPPEVRDLGQVITEIGVAVIKPAEFVIFRLSQWAGSGS